MFARLIVGPVLLASLLAGCGGEKHPVAPTPAAPTVSELRIGIAGNAQPTVEPGKSVQLFAQAVMSDGSVQDVTNTATWQSANPVVAVVSPTGLVTTYAAGEASITATWTKTSSIALQVKKECIYTLSPASLEFDAFGRASVQVEVTSSLAGCSWSASSGVPWLRLVGTARGTGNGDFVYDALANSTTETRAADITISGDQGTVVHHVSQARPATCSYVVDPLEVVVSVGGGTGSVRVDTTPDNCQWRPIPFGSVNPENANSYTPTTGDFTLRYRAYPGPAGSTATISICGLSGVNPCGMLIVRWR